MALFPFVGIFKGIDIQPFFFLGIIAYLLFGNLIIKPQSLLLAMLLIFPALFWGNFKFLFQTIVFIVTFSLANNFISGLDKKILALVFLVYVLVGVIQLWHPLFMSGVLNRSAELVTMASDSGRGVRSLTAEPSDLSRMFLLLNILYLVADGKKTHSILFLLGSVVISQSAYGVIIHVIALFLLMTGGIYVFLSYAALAFVLLYLPFLLFPGSRFVLAMDWLLNNRKMLLTQGAFKRVLNVPITFHGISHYGLLGSEYFPSVVKSTMTTPIGGMKFYIQHRNLGGLFELVLRYGLFGIPVLLHILFPFRYWRSSKFRYFILILLIGCQDGQVLHPLYWITYYQVITYVRSDL